MRGRFIAIEGLDGSGGTTQIALLAEALRQPGAPGGPWTVHTTAEPSTGPIGRMIREALGGRLDLGDGVLPYLFAADRQDHLEREVEPALAAGHAVLTDRYYASSLAYQSLAAPLGFVAGLNARFRAPDLTVFLDLPVEACVERILKRGAPRDRFETEGTLREISAAYGAALALLADRGDRIAHVDASGTPAQVHARVMEQVAACLS
ncbi:MAG: dTMP kinase [Alphaproteobacteria bacterium]|nr:dTMP kinase [Alphaproteobacteria bacterium]